MFGSETAKVLDGVLPGCNKIQEIKRLRLAVKKDEQSINGTFSLLAAKELVEMVVDLKSAANPSNFDELEFYHVLRDNVPILSEKEAKLVLQIVKDFLR